MISRRLVLALMLLAVVPAAMTAAQDSRAALLAQEWKAKAPPELLAGRHAFVSARLRAFHADQPAWSSPLDVYFRRTTDGWALVGLERHP